MAQADDKPILWAPLVEGLALVEKIYGRAVAESDLRGLLRDGVLPWRGERRGGLESDPGSGDRNVWRRESPDVDLRIVWKENRLVRTVRVGRTFPRPGERVFRPAPRQYHFVRIEIDMGRLRALMLIDAPAEANPAKKTIRAAKPKPKLGLAEKWLRAAFPGLEPASIPRDVSAGEADRRIRGLDGGPTIDLSTLKRAMGRKK